MSTEALERLNQINELVREIGQALVEESTTPEIWQAVCNRLAASEFYEAAWTSARPVTEQRVTPDVWAGIEEDCLQTITDASNGMEPSELPLQVVE